MKRTFLILLVALFPLAGFCQPADSLRVVHWLQQAKQLMHTQAQDSEVYLDSIGRYLKQHPGKDYFQAEYDKTWGMYYYRMNQMDSAIVHYQQAQVIYQQLDSLLDQAKIEINLSMAYNRLGDYEQSIALALQSLRKFEQLQDYKVIGIANNMVGHVYYFQEDYQQALQYFRQFTANARLAGDSVNLASGYGNMGSAWSELQQLDSAEYYQQQALAMARQLGNLYSVANSLNNLAGYAQTRQQWQQAFQYYNKAMITYKQLHDTLGIGRSYINMAKTQNSMGQYARAIPLLQQGRTLVTQTRNVELQKEAWQALSVAYEAQGEHARALQAYKTYSLLSDSLLNADKARAIAKLNTQYKTEKKERQITILDQQTQLQQAEIARQDLRLQRNTIFIVALLAALVLLSLLYYIWRLRFKQKQAALLHAQQVQLKEAQLQAEIESQEQERQRFASDLHDGMGQLIAAMQLSIDKLGDNIPAKEKAKAHGHARELVQQSHQEIRRIAFDLMPRVLSRQGLPAAIQALADSINPMGKLHVQVNCEAPATEWPEKQKVALYRVVQELLSNITKHARAQEVHIQLYPDDDQVVLSMEDDGQGFDVHQFKQAKGYGWYNIRSRLDVLNASIEWDTRPGRQGSTVMVWIPHPNPTDASATHTPQSPH